MKLDKFKEKLAEALSPRQTFITKDGDFLRITVKLAGKCKDCFMVGYVPVRFRPDFNLIASQVCEADKRKVCTKSLLWTARPLSLKILPSCAL